MTTDEPVEQAAVGEPEALTYRDLIDLPVEVTADEPVTSVEEGCTCGGMATCQQCQERDAARRRLMSDKVREVIITGLRRCRVEDAPSPLIHEADMQHISYMVFKALRDADLLKEQAEFSDSLHEVSEFDFEEDT